MYFFFQVEPDNPGPRGEEREVECGSYWQVEIRGGLGEEDYGKRNSDLFLGVDFVHRNLAPMNSLQFDSPGHLSEGSLSPKLLLETGDLCASQFREI